ncbi:RNA dependent RNA polymerase-domain-containing protein [Melanogaster broomeanus]|nr:RNA dependent RNA polymerase-domain-containing protein [Melanogaster broomeanus]
MEFDIRNIDFKADKWQIMKAIAAQVLHKSPGPFVAGPDDPLPNFNVQLEMREDTVLHNGYGVLTVTRKVGQKFLPLNRNHEISVKVHGRKLKFFPNDNLVKWTLVLELEKVPFIHPDIAQDRQRKIESLEAPFFVDHLQIGTFYYPKNTHTQDPAFSVEWDQDFSHHSQACLFFDYEHKLLRVRIGDPITEQTYYSVIVKFASINKMTMGHDLKTRYICFNLFTPPVIQKEKIHRPLTLDKYRHRVGSLSPGHAIVAPYAHHLRIVLYDNGDRGEGDVLKGFEKFCQFSLLRPPQEVATRASCQHFFSNRKLKAIDGWLRDSPLNSNWRVAFQVEALLHNGAANTAELEELRPRIEELIRCHQDVAGDVMRHVAEGAARRPPGQPAEEFFETVLQKTLRPRPTPPRGCFLCHHVTFTPTRMILEGPTIMQSNRVIREYEGYEDNFLRVDFRDEDRLQYRWDRDDDGASYLQERVGTLLKKGFDLAGRHFTFLGYSASALREHAVWFVSAFRHPKWGSVTARSIQHSLGDFREVIYSPSKYGARMAQAFSATDPSVHISRKQWSIIPDIVENDINFTDGIGTISLELGDLIWTALCNDTPTLAANPTKPTAYQIRFLGCKGVVSVDERLIGIHMCIRPSMQKFKIPGKTDGTIEIARAVLKPNVPHLNRPMVMVLEDRGVPKEVFLKLQELVIAKARMAHDSATRFVELLEAHHLCFNYRLGAILRKLNSLGLELKPNHMQRPLDTPFFAQLRWCAVNHVLRAVKYEARIPIPDSHMLLGVADEGPAYVEKGLKNVYCLPQGRIFACVQRPGDEEPTYMKGMCQISRSPVIHPGDVQRVYAIGKPPEGKVCLFSHLKNVVVFASTGTWSLPNALGGGDLDGDMYEVVQYGELLVPEHHDPAYYPSVGPFQLDRPSTIDDICDFIVEYIHSDVVGLVSDKHIVIAGNTPCHGTLDPSCLLLARWHSLAVDYPKSGNKVDISEMPRSLVRFKPDWHMTQDDVRPASDYYTSSRALGYLFRNIELEEIPKPAPPGREKPQAHEHPISVALLPYIRRHLRGLLAPPPTVIDSLYVTYREELAYIASTYSLSTVPGARLREVELVIGTILATSPQKRFRSSRLYAMRDNVAFLVQDIKEQLVGRLEDLSEDVLTQKLAIAWAVWRFSLEKAGLPADENFGSQSFGLIGLGLVLECLERLGSLPPS